MKQLFLILSIGIVLMSIGCQTMDTCQFIPTNLIPLTNGEKKEDTTVIPNGTSEMKKLQVLLKEAGYDPKGADGKYGNQTRQAIKQFQKEKGFTVDGQPTRKLFGQLKDSIKKDNSSSATVATKPAATIGSPKYRRSECDLDHFFTKGTVRGDELIKELMAIKEAAQQAETHKAFTSLMGEVDGSLEKMRKTNIQKFQKLGDLIDPESWKNLLKILFDVGCEQLKTTMNHKAINMFIDTMLDERELLEKQFITLPSAEGFTRNQKQRILNIAAFTVGARVANDSVNDAKATLENLEAEYNELLRHREVLAEVLADVVARRNEALRARDELRIRRMENELLQYLTKEDLKFIDQFGSEHTVSEFAKDFALQNMAIRYLQRQDPERYKNYRAQVDGLVGRTKVAVRTLGGALSFGGLAAGFTNDVLAFAENTNMDAFTKGLPLFGEFLKAALPLAGNVAETAITGVVLEPEKTWLAPFAAKRFRVTMAGNEKKTDLRSASNVFDLMHKNQTNEEIFKNTLFSNGGNGFLLSMYRHDPDTTGRMLDASISEEMRNQFGEEYMHMSGGEDYSFVNALTSSDKRSIRHIVNNMLSRDQRRRADSPFIGKIQQESADNSNEWNSTQLTRLILSNHHGSIDYAQMQVGDMMIRLIPSMTALYEYECFADTVRRTASL